MAAHKLTPAFACGEKIGPFRIEKYDGRNKMPDGWQHCYVCRCERCGTIKHLSQSGLRNIRNSNRKHCVSCAHKKGKRTSKTMQEEKLAATDKLYAKEDATARACSALMDAWRVPAPPPGDSELSGNTGGEKDD